MDIFMPRHEPAKTIYLAFQAEAALRRGRKVEEWTRLEIDAVHKAAGDYASAHGLSTPTREQIVSAEIYARGSVDYGAKWAYQVCRHMLPGNKGD